jgi:hypothetical protein
MSLPDTLSDNRAMTKLDISSNNIGAEGSKALAAGLKCNQVITELNISSNNISNRIGGYDETSITSGVIAIADAIPDMKVLTKLDISNNDIGAFLFAEGWRTTGSSHGGNCNGGIRILMGGTKMNSPQEVVTIISLPLPMPSLA